MGQATGGTHEVLSNQMANGNARANEVLVRGNVELWDGVESYPFERMLEHLPGEKVL